ncbi:unnamed protein product, partial [Prorocentrum cordatum]
AVKKRGGSISASVQIGTQAGLDAARKIVNDKKLMLSRHTAVGHKLARCKMQYEKGQIKIEDQTKVEIDALQIELPATMRAVAPEPAVDTEVFDLPSELLEQGDAAEFKAMVESPAR